jgi:hypothetical protein
MNGIPGAHWWKFDIHTHSPFSTDFGKGPDQAALQQATPEEWLLAFMSAGIDCVAVTDHNGGSWFDKLVTTLAELDQTKPAGYRPLHLFPGVEVAASAGVHVLGVLSRDKTGADVAALVGAFDYKGEHGAADGTCPQSAEEVIEKIAERAGLPILAHVDQPKGAFVALTGRPLLQVIEHPRLAAIERRDSGSPTPQSVTDRRLKPTEVVGSDAHHLSSAAGPCFPGSRFTWIKMGPPSLEGLRLALIDGNDFSVLRSDTVSPGFDPNRTPEDWIEAVEVSNGRYFGRSQRQRVAFSPWMTALVGGRGTGKSSVVHFLRAALRREDELRQFDEDIGPQATFRRFFKVPKSRADEGALCDDTEISVVYQHGGTHFRIHWRQSSQPPVVEEWSHDAWRVAASQDVRDRFPVRIFSQGQILAMADAHGDALTALIDDAIGARGWRDRMVQAENAFLAIQAKRREFGQKVAGADRVLGQLDDVRRKLAKFEETQHATILREFQRRNRQARQVDTEKSAVLGLSGQISDMAARTLISDVPAGLFDPSDAADRAALENLAELRLAVGGAAEALNRVSVELATAVTAFDGAIAGSPWMTAVVEARRKHEELLVALREQGVKDPDEYARLVQDRQRLETEVAQIESLKDRLRSLAGESETTLGQLLELRRELRAERRRFVSEKLTDNPFVRIRIVGYGRIAKDIERSFRDVINVQDDRFTSDIYQEEAGLPSGLMHELMHNLPAAEEDAEQKVEERLKAIKSRLDQAASGRPTTLGGHFANFLQRETQRRPEILDRLLAWFPEDAVRVDYSPRGDGSAFRPITQASGGQRASAMLAFLLAYGDEPIVLDQPEDDLDNHLIYDLLVRQLRQRKQHRQVIVVSHNPNVVVNGDAELVNVFDFVNGECRVIESGCLQDASIRKEICTVMEGGREAFERRYRRLGHGGSDV